MNILVIINGTVFVSDSLINLCMEIFQSPIYCPISRLEYFSYLPWFQGVRIWTEPLGRLSNLLCLGYAIERYVIICDAKGWAQCHSYMIVAVYVIITILVEFSYPFIYYTTNYDYLAFDASKATCLVLSVSHFLKFSIAMFGLICHILVVLAMNKRLDTSIILHSSLKKGTSVKNCEQIKKFNLSILILLVCHTLINMICEVPHMVEPILCMIDFDGVSSQLRILYFYLFHIIEKVKNVEEAVAQILFIIFHFIFLPSFYGFLSRTLLYVSHLVHPPVDPSVIN